jgi:DNA-binding NarL/FixJ family response regulator
MARSRFPLLPREVDVLIAAANGEKRAVTAARLGWSLAKVQHHRKRAIQVLDAVNMPHAVGLAFARGVLRRVDVDLDWRGRFVAAAEKGGNDG